MFSQASFFTLSKKLATLSNSMVPLRGSRSLAGTFLRLHRNSCRLNFKSHAFNFTFSLDVRTESLSGIAEPGY